MILERFTLEMRIDRRMEANKEPESVRNPNVKRSNFLYHAIDAREMVSQCQPISIRDGISSSDLSEATAAWLRQSAAAIDRSTCLFCKTFARIMLSTGRSWWLYPTTESIVLRFSRLEFAGGGSMGMHRQQNHRPASRIQSLRPQLEPVERRLLLTTYSGTSLDAQPWTRPTTNLADVQNGPMANAGQDLINVYHHDGKFFCTSYARSSRARASTDPAFAPGGVAFVDLAGDAVTWSAQATTNAPATLTTAQLAAIYNCTDTNWGQVGGANAPIHAFIPQSGSGTRAFFLSAIGVATPGSCVSDDNVNHFNETFIGSALNRHGDILRSDILTGGEANGRLANNKRVNVNGDYGIVAELTRTFHSPTPSTSGASAMRGNPPS